MRIATRTSPLAMAQATLVVDALAAIGHRARVVGVRTEGDLDRSTPISELAGRGVFVAGVQQAVLDGRADVAVHSAKDMRSSVTDGLTMVGCLRRGDAREALVVGSGAGAGGVPGEPPAARALGLLPPDATVATGSVRRQVQLAALRPDLRFVGLRGNIATRLEVVNEPGVDAVLVACAALERLGLVGRADAMLDVEVVVPQAGQGAIALEVRADDAAARSLLSGVLDRRTTNCVGAERAVLAAFGGGCDLPIGAHATQSDAGELSLVAMVAERRPADASGPVPLHRAQVRGTDGERLGTQLAHDLMAAASYSPGSAQLPGSAQSPGSAQPPAAPLH